MDKQIARKAASWWADFLRGTAPLDNGDRTPAGVRTDILAAILQEVEKSKSHADDAGKFEDELARLLEKKSEKWLSFGVDYSPDYILSEAAEAAGVDLGMTRLPWKTVMMIDDGKITYRLGGADWTKLT